MTDTPFLIRRNSRTNLYGASAKPLDPNRTITLLADPIYAETYAGQVALLTGANLIGRMTPSVVIDVPDRIQVHAQLPWAGRLLQDIILEQLFAATPQNKGGRFVARSAQSDDCVLYFGLSSSTGAAVVHGCGWNSYFGRSASPIETSISLNPCGPAFAAILAGAHLMASNLQPPANDFLCNALDWSACQAPNTAPQPDPACYLGNLTTVGTGSVGTAALYFLSLFTRQFDVALIDMDFVEIENLDRSPIFAASDEGLFKVDATAAYLREIGVGNVREESCELAESTLWQLRQEGTPDIVIATANENHVRFLIEVAMPPIQIYGTTGKNWQATVYRHIPHRDPCSLCVFPDVGPQRPTTCATGKAIRETDGKQIDAALPFLSFAAGLMATAEILKLNLSGFPFAPSETQFAARGDNKLTSVPLTARPDCICQRNRSSVLHQSMIAGSRYAHLSVTGV